MITTNTYLHFDGNCREAMTFYGKCLQTEPGFTPFSIAPPELPEIAKTTPDRILHSELHSGPVVLMASDTLPGMPFKQGNNFAISITCESMAELDRLFASFSENGKVTMALHDAFWGGRFGMLTDQFGINWMFSFRASG
jgi:PhnB protein